MLRILWILLILAALFVFFARTTTTHVIRFGLLLALLGWASSIYTLDQRLKDAVFSEGKKFVVIQLG